MKRPALFNVSLVRTTAMELLRGKLASRFDIPSEIEDYVVMDEETGVPQPIAMSMSTVYLDVLEDLMSIMTAWAGTLVEVTDDLEMELKNAEARKESLEYNVFLNAGGSVENRKKIAKLAFEVQQADFDQRVYDYAHTKVHTLADRLDRFVGVLKYAHRRTQERGARTGTLPGHT